MISADDALKAHARTGSEPAHASLRDRLKRGWLVTMALLVCVTGSNAVMAAATLPDPVVHADFDELSAGKLPGGLQIKTQFSAPDVVPGVAGSAWRTDGFSSYAEGKLSLSPSSGLTLSLWVALESYPSDLEVPVKDMVPSSFIQQAAGGKGFDLYIDAYGRWGFKVATSAGVLRIQAKSKFPLRRWVHLVATVDVSTGVASLYQGDELIGTVRGVPGMTLELASTPLRLAAAPTDTKILDFTINRLNGAFDQVAVYAAALNAEQRRLLSGPSSTTSAEPALVVPATRFANDTLRPRVHPLPPANWTNEPHGLIRIGDTWHVFYQRTPNGPFKTLMHWGHMTSRDLVVWESQPDALMPELQSDDFGFDMKGIWSGHVIADGGKAFAFYTSVNHGDRLAASNPGVAMAISEDPQLREWKKTGPILNSRGARDMRDPFLWKEGGTWHMIIGAALDTGGGLLYYVLEPGDKGGRWQPRPRFTDPSYRMLDIGSEIWEMPVFEQLSDGVWILLVNPIGGKVSKYGEPSTRAVYWTGTWSDGTFKPFSPTPKLLDLVPGHLAPTVGRADDGSLRAIGIIDERRTPLAQRQAGWAHTFSLPRTWYLLRDNRTLGQRPAPELVKLRQGAVVDRSGVSIGRDPVSLDAGHGAYEMLIELDDAPADAAPVQLDVLASPDGREFTRLIFDRVRGEVMVDKSRSTLSADGEGPQVMKGSYAADSFGAMRRIRAIVDGSTVEVFINDAAAYSVRSYPSLANSTGIRISADTAQPMKAAVKVWPLRLPQ
ncbi:GH32 C-terminal domain-containing protein [Roseateles sp. BYS78W]|uniref:beta-fructofuranosidase n=1 Tax=Pelomonas candidula TaxID=3299025 RepID=A0ABW7HJS5_9BURK